MKNVYICPVCGNEIRIAKNKKVDRCKFCKRFYDINYSKQAKDYELTESKNQYHNK